MQVSLEVQSGPQRGKQIELRSPGKVVVGRTAPAQMVIAEDTLLSTQHFAIEIDGERCVLRDLKSRFGTLVGGKPVTEHSLADGDTITAGQTRFLVRVQGGTASEPGEGGTATPSADASLAQAVPGSLAERVLQALQKEPQPLFAVLDAARDSFVVKLLESSKEEFQSLYEGPQGEEMAEFGPYLVRLLPASPVLATLVEQGWGKSWGVYLCSPAPFAEVRKHLRRFLLVQMGDGRQVYFRYYDPRVLRAFLPVCTAQEATEFFGPITRYLMEARQPGTLLRFQPGPQGTEPAAQLLAG